MRFLVVSDATEPCPYLPGHTMRLPLRMALGRLSPDDFDVLLSEGDRRTGPLLYRPTCPDCTACEAIRVPVQSFRPSRSQRRVLRRNDTDVRVERHRPALTPQHLAMYNRHSHERGLSLRDGPAGETDYRFFLVESCVDTWEVRYLVGDRLVAVSVMDFGRNAVSSVYHYFDPGEARRSLGVYSVLKEIQLCAELGIDWYYLGLYVADCRHLNYKAGYFPHDRRIRGTWQRFDPRDDEGALEDGTLAVAPGGNHDRA